MPTETFIVNVPLWIFYSFLAQFWQFLLSCNSMLTQYWITQFLHRFHQNSSSVLNQFWLYFDFMYFSCILILLHHEFWLSFDTIYRHKAFLLSSNTFWCNKKKLTLQREHSWPKVQRHNNTFCSHPSTLQLLSEYFVQKHCPIPREMCKGVVFEKHDPPVNKEWFRVVLRIARLEMRSL